MPFSIGDPVKVISVSDALDPDDKAFREFMIGRVGVVGAICAECHEEYAVRFEAESQFLTDCDGVLPDAHGWWFTEDELEATEGEFGIVGGL